MSQEPVRPLHFAAFVMNTTSHIVQGTWRRPSSRSADFNDLDHWVNLAKTLERGKFDAIFFADVVGLYAPYRGDERKYFEAGLQVPSNDPSVLASAIAYATEHLGIAFTASILQEHPFNFARRISTLDHATKGRIAWNIVTNYLPNASRNFGLEGLTAHDARYAWADEYVDVTYKLWEGSWDDDALLQDRERGVHADYDKVHRINHVGERYQVEGPHLVSPSPQRTPFLFQAGASEAGRNFAAQNAEAVFLGTPNREAALRDTSDIRRRAVALGRRADDLKFFQGLYVVPTSTEAEAARVAAELDEWIDHDGHLAHMSGSIGIDFGHDDLDTPVGEIKTEGVQSMIGWINDLVTGRPATLRDVAHHTATNLRIIGTPEKIADELAAWQQSGVDGINLMNYEIPTSYEDFVDQVIPTLQKRGLIQSEYSDGTLRQKIFGEGDRLPDRHHATRYRGAFGAGAGKAGDEAFAGAAN
ncbi:MULTISPECIES: LLM class flavin-dependent oxidoreductase [Gordonia]|uniref:LLM class flavin-dependent oxidoreductase n=2 Tax=Gordonia amicalis TaxID=89053 RepID=A0AAE4U1U2_9ACTN|nr:MULTISPECIES: LLM class flavin-dependent oxidoreductase [Gordonia]MCZ4581787.1 LLM class flavin-dependent oxidoreductase [Gordonia amicalis]MCZ4652366.1 LLM class flavin-dependent oxidoreductase [Gordonia amicalis]MDJ0453416.1 LLM class flavin-dependent oxidoreductase [Gordonia amicalis]MDV6308332.1 LLM class flavin-dependent oxidoreductase [Gordonia amicalis]MDV6314359.1 LLM class flavin-dependent oxidoreductase [Gordonia amicalis]